MTQKRELFLTGLATKVHSVAELPDLQRETPDHPRRTTKRKCGFPARLQRVRHED